MQGIRTFGKGVKILRDEIKEDVKVQHIQMLIKLALSSPEPVTYTDLCAAIGTTKASISRNMKVLGSMMIQDKSGNWKDEGLGLVNVRPNPFNTREYVAELTTRGVEIMKKLDKAVSS